MIQADPGLGFSRKRFGKRLRKVGRKMFRGSGLATSTAMMRRGARGLSGEPDGLGFSLKPPKFIRKAFASIVKSTTATVPTPTGPMTVDFGNPDSIAAAKAAVRGIRVETGGNKPAGPLEQANATITENVPGGWLTIAAGAALALAFLTKRGRR